MISRKQRIEEFRKAIEFILDKVRFNEKGNTLDGSRDFQAGYYAGFTDCLQQVRSTKGQFESAQGLAARQCAGHARQQQEDIDGA